MELYEMYSWGSLLEVRTIGRWKWRPWGPLVSRWISSPTSLRGLGLVTNLRENYKLDGFGNDADVDVQGAIQRRAGIETVISHAGDITDFRRRLFAGDA